MSGGIPAQPVADMFGSVAVTANAEEAWSKSASNTVLGTTGIEHPQAPQDNVEWRGNYVYYGKYDGNPVKYRILDADSQEFVPKKDRSTEPKDPTQKTLFLESDSTVGGNIWNYGEKKYDWSESVLRRQLQQGTFYNKDGVFTQAEKDAIFSSVKYSKSTGEKADGVGYDPNGTSQASLWFEPLSGDTIFVLDAKEATNPYYGYANTDVAHKSKNRGTWHWLRSVDYQWKGQVNNEGVIKAVSYTYSNACPAFNVDLKKVLFSSLVAGDASAEYGKEYKLTLKDDNFGIGITSGQYVTYRDSTRTVYVPYTVTDRDDNIDPNTISVLITDLNGNIVDYHSISDAYSAKGTVSFTLPTNAPQNYHVYILAENRNDIHETDYASPMTEIHVPITYTIRYVLNGGNNLAANPSTYIDDRETTLYAPYRSHYIFDGWYDNSNFTGDPITSIPKGSSGNKVFYAKWTPETYNVTLNKNGGTIIGDDLTQYTYGVGATLPQITKDHYTFNGWFVRDSYGNELKYTQIKPNNYGDKSYYAKWTANKYIISYELNGGTVSTANPTSYNAETAMPFTLRNPTRTGYTFTGWSGTGIEGTSKNVVISDCSAGNRNYTANWSVNHYTVKFDKNNANVTGTMADQTFTYDTEQSLTENGFTTPIGYHFAGWATSSNGNAVYTDKQAILNMTPVNNKVITLYAVWVANTYTIHFEKNHDNAYGEMPDQVFTYDDQATKLSKRAFIFTTADFLGWATSEDGEVVYSDQQEVRNLTAEDGAEITLYAKWKRKYKVLDNTENYDLFYCRLAGGTQSSFWFYPGDKVQIYKTNNSKQYVIKVKDEDGNVIKTIDETQPGTLDYTFTMPEKNLLITIGDTVITKLDYLASISLDGRDQWDDTAYLYNADNPTVTPTVTVTCDGETLTEGTDYTLEILNNTGSPDYMVEAVVTVTGKGNYCGSQTRTFRITPFNVVNCQVKGKLEAYNDGYGPHYPLSQNVEVWNGKTQLEEDVDYYIELDPDLDIYDDYEIGETYTATITGTGDWGGTKTFEFTFVALSHTIMFDANGGTGTMEDETISNNGGYQGRYYLPECPFTPQDGYEFDYWKVYYDNIEENPIKQPGDYFSAPYIWSDYDVQTITVTAHWKRKVKYSVTLPDNMVVVSGNIDSDGKAYNGEVITFKAKDGYTVFDIKNGNNTITAENGIYTVTVTADTTVTAKVLDGNTCYFDESTSTLHLRGNVNKADVQQYKNNAMFVAADTGAVLPEKSSSLFGNFANAISFDLKNADTSSVTDMSYMFYNCKAITNLDLNTFDTSSVTDMGSMFEKCTVLTSLNIGSFDTSCVTNMNGMFRDCNALTSLDISGFDTSSVTNMNSMFKNCTVLASLNLSGFDTSSVTTMQQMFYCCEKLTSLDLSSFDTSSVTNMNYIFWMENNAENDLTTIYVSENWNTDKVTSFDHMFDNCTKLKGGNGTTFDSSKIDKTYAVIDKDGQAGYFTGIYTMALPDNMEIVTDAGADKKVGGRYLNGAVVTFRFTGTVPDHSYLIVKAGYTILTADENGIYTVTVTDNTAVSAEIDVCEYTVTLPKNMEFVGTVSDSCEYGTVVSFKPTEGYIVKGNVTANGTALTAENGVYSLTVTEDMTVSANVDVESYFNSTTGTLTLKGTILKNNGDYGSIILPNGVKKSDVLHIAVDANGVTFPQDSSSLFYNFDKTESIDLANADTSNVTNMYGMFHWCDNLTSLDLSSFNTSSVTNMKRMFNCCASLKSLDLSSFNTSSVTDMSNMFYDCESLTSLDLSNFNTSSVTDMSGMFMCCDNLTSLDLSSFNTSKVEDLKCMFSLSDNNKLTTIYVGKNWIISETASSSLMFDSCTRLVGGSGTTFDSTKIDKTYAHIDGGTNNPGYFSKHTITVNNIEHGSVTVNNADNIFPGDTVTLNVSTNAGYTLKSLTVKKSDGSNVTVTNNQFTMPYDNVVISAVFDVDNPLENKSTVSSEAITIGDTLTVKGAAQGGTAPAQQFRMT